VQVLGLKKIISHQPLQFLTLSEKQLTYKKWSHILQRSEILLDALL